MQKTDSSIEQLQDQIAKFLLNSPGFDRMPLPVDMYRKFNLPPPKIMTLRESLKLHYETQLASLNSSDPVEQQLAVNPEIRPPAEGGIRPIYSVEIPELKVFHNKTFKDIDLSGNLIETNEVTPSEESK